MNCDKLSCFAFNLIPFAMSGKELTVIAPISEYNRVFVKSFAVSFLEFILRLKQLFDVLRATSILQLGCACG